jgi:aminoglycoside phosphotransferase family enzyme/predicted kinase
MPAPHDPDPSAQAEIITFLAGGGGDGHAGPVAIAETHISRVFLAGDRAIKLKKPVRFNYLDYSTPALREAACRAELAVNQRFAPGLYQRVAPVVRAADGRLALDGSGETVDWVLIMRRFEADAQLDHVAARGALTEGLARALADRIADLHAEAPRRPEHGGAAGLRRAFDITAENLRIAASGVAPRLPASAAEHWVARAGAALGALTPLLDRRRQDGRVRACHGDLHLANICILDGAPMPFDAIEFAASIACIDVLYDLAFLLMDMHARGLSAASCTVFNRYLDRCDEADGLPALPLFLSLRAAIRAQVLAAAGKPEAARYLALANALLDPQPARLIAIGGASGTGKTTLAGRIAPCLGRVPGARVLRSDVLRKRRAGVAPEMPLPSGHYTADVHAAVYRTLADAARTCLAAGQAVVADAVFGLPAEREAIEAVARAHGVPFQGLWLEADADALVARVAGRTADASDATPAVVRAQLAGSTQQPPAGAAGWMRIAAGGEAAATECAARAALGLPLAPAQ